MTYIELIAIVERHEYTISIVLRFSFPCRKPTRGDEKRCVVRMSDEITNTSRVMYKKNTSKIATLFDILRNGSRVMLSRVLLRWVLISLGRSKFVSHVDLPLCWFTVFAHGWKHCLHFVSAMGPVVVRLWDLKHWLYSIAAIVSPMIVRWWNVRHWFYPVSAIGPIIQVVRWWNLKHWLYSIAAIISPMIVQWWNVRHWLYSILIIGPIIVRWWRHWYLCGVAD